MILITDPIVGPFGSAGPHALALLNARAANAPKTTTIRISFIPRP